MATFKKTLPKIKTEEYILTSHHYAKLVKLMSTDLTREVIYQSAAYEEMISGLKKESASPLGCLVIIAAPSPTQTRTVARELSARLGKMLHQAKPSELPSKYIGETEKNLSRLLDRATYSGWILFFDEADALFGKRTEVKDTHDRYAKQETSNLIEKLDKQQGIVIMGCRNSQELLKKLGKIRKFVVKVCAGYV